MEQIQNEGPIDRGIRLFLAIGLLIAAMLAPFSSAQQVFLGLGAGVVFLTAAVGFCPLYPLVHLNTNRHKPA